MKRKEHKQPSKHKTVNYYQGLEAIELEYTTEYIREDNSKNTESKTTEQYESHRNDKSEVRWENNNYNESVM
jgi:hypothetical protein